MAKLLDAAPCTSCGKTLPKSALSRPPTTWRGKGVGHVMVESLVEKARTLGVSRVFCLTFEVDFFVRHGFEVMADQSAVDPEVYSELLRSHDEGVAEFLDLARVKPNTLGNTRMIKHL